MLDDYSRYIITWRLCRNMTAIEVKKILDLAIARTGVKHVHVYHRPRLLSDNGPCFIYLGLDAKIIRQRKKTKAKTMRLRRKTYQDLSLKHLMESLNSIYYE